MAQELHDGVGHGLAVIAMQAGVALHVLDRDPAKARGNLEAIRSASQESLDALRSELARMSGTPGARRPAPGSTTSTPCSIGSAAAGWSSSAAAPSTGCPRT